MEKIFRLMSFVAIATLIFSGCNKENSVNEQQDVVLNFNIESNNGDDDTKVVYKTEWANNDTLYLLFNLFDEDYDPIFTPEDYITLTYNSEKTKWNVIGGQDVLNNKITKDSGYVHICYCKGTPTVSGEEIIFPNAGEKFFLLNQSTEYKKEGNIITITEDENNTFSLCNGLVQFNVKIPYNKYSKVVMENFYTNGWFGDNPDASGYKEIKFTNDGIRKIKKGEGIGNYPAQKTSDENEMAFFFQPNNWEYTESTTRIKLKITIDGADYTIRKDFNNLILSPNQCYSIIGPTADENTIKTAPEGEGLGEGWFKSEKNVTFN